MHFWFRLRQRKEKKPLNLVTGKSLSEALIFASTNPEYDNRLFIELQFQYMKIPGLNHRRMCCVTVDSFQIGKGHSSINFNLRLIFRGTAFSPAILQLFHIK